MHYEFAYKIIQFLVSSEGRVARGKTLTTSFFFDSKLK